MGDELVRGELADTNTSHIASRLAELGIEFSRATLLPDEVIVMAREFGRAAARSELVMVTGGLGPTQDDLTRDALAKAAGVALREDDASVLAIAERLGTAPSLLPPNNRRQAFLPEGARPLKNTLGTAPGVELRLGRATFFALPGVPREMKEMLEREVVPRLPRGPAFESRRLVFGGLGESRVDAAMAELGLWEEPGLQVGTRAGGGLTTAVFRSSGEGARERVERASAKLREKLDEFFVCEGEGTLAQVVARGLIERGLTVAFAESCTAGLAASTLAQVPGVSAAFLMGVVAYSNQVKVRLLGVDEGTIGRKGAVSEEVACSMAEGARASSGADIGVSTTGVAGPSGGSPEKPVGTVWFGVSSRRGTRGEKRFFRGERNRIRTCAANWALVTVLKEACALGEEVRPHS